MSARRARPGGLAVVVFTVYMLLALVLAAGAGATVLLLPGEESGEQVTSGRHIVGIGALSPVPRAGVSDQWRIDQFATQGARPVLAHPYDSQFPTSAILGFNGLFGLEVFHKGSVFTNKWNAVLAGGVRVWGLGVDDSHNQLGADKKPFIMARASELSQTAILAALDAGDFYPTQGPLFVDLGVRSGPAVWAQTEDVGTFLFFTARGAVAKVIGVTQAQYRPKTGDGYVRIAFTRASDGLQASSQPFYVDAGVPADPYAGSGTWYKGNTHFHTTASDGTLSPADALSWYASHGYSFLSPGDHNVVTTDFVRPTVDDLVASSATFSPNSDGYLDKVGLTYTMYEPAQTRLRIFDKNSALVKTVSFWTDRSAGEQTFTWDGKYTTPTGTYTYAPDGRYQALVEVRDAVGNVGSQSVFFVLDRTITKVSVGTVRFSPNGDGARDTSSVSYTLSRAADVTVYARDAAGGYAGEVRAPVAKTAGTYSFTWDGSDTSGAALPEGDYTIVVAATSTIGSCEAVKAVTIDLTAPLVSTARLDPAAFAAADGTTLRYDSDSAGSYTLVVVNRYGKTQRILSGTVIVGANAVRWNGRMTDGTLVAPGTYTLKLSVKDAASNKSVPATVSLSASVTG